MGQLEDFWNWLDIDQVTHIHRRREGERAHNFMVHIETDYFSHLSLDYKSGTFDIAIRYFS